MLKGKLIHPEILEALGRAGHGSRILIGDGNYPFASKLGPNARLVSLNLSPGLVTTPQVLEALVEVVPIEAACVMQYETTGPYALRADPPVWNEFRRVLRDAGMKSALAPLERQEFYRAAGGPEVVLTVATGDLAAYANLLLTIGVVGP